MDPASSPNNSAFHSAMNGKQRPMIIALQGDPCTGKTYVANQLARSFKCSTIRLDDVLDVMFPAVKPKNADALISQAFDVVTEVVDTQARNLGLSIIVDSPLSRRSHLQSLIAVSSASAADLIIIECKPKTTYTWLMRFENHTYVDKNKWYKPHSWPFHPWFSRDYDDDDDKVPKLVLNITDPYLVFGLPNVIRGLIKFGEGRKVDYDVWWPIVRAKNAEKNGTPVVKPVCSARLGHHLNVYMKQGQLEQEAKCSVCLKLFSIEGELEDSMAYKCSGCPYAMHKSCAELDGSGIKAFTPLNFPKFIRLSKPRQAEYCYPDKHSCVGCEKQGKEFSYECGYCVFETHARCKLVPTIVNRPEVHDHALHFWTNSALPVGRVSSTYHCRACRDVSITLAGYLCGSGCMFYYHAECLLLPPTVLAHEHGGYAHDMELVLRREEELEDYLCCLCHEQMNPDAWFYCCKPCHIDLHPKCAFKVFD
ncbi:hypothetical protein V2J09_021624 [Rumex salicifolius]